MGVWIEFCKSFREEIKGILKVTDQNKNQENVKKTKVVSPKTGRMLYDGKIIWKDHWAVQNQTTTSKIAADPLQSQFPQPANSITRSQKKKMLNRIPISSGSF
jgi:hypothetical protein